MLTAFRRLGDTLFIKAFLMLLAFSFVAWGINGYLSGGTYGEAITIDDTSISLQTIDRGFASRKQMLEQAMGTTLTAEQMLQQGYTIRYLVRLLQETVLLQAAKDTAFTAPDSALTKLIESTDLFKQDGEFDVDTYKRNLRTIGYTAAGYEQEQRRALTVEFMSSAFTPPALPENLLKPILVRHKQTLDIETLKLTQDSLKKLPQPSEDALLTYYQAHQPRYSLPAERDIAVLTLSPTALAASLTPSAEEALAFYKENQDIFTTPASRRARQILVSTKEEAVALKEQLDNGADFAELAKTHSLDKASAQQGGDLGTFTAAETLPILAEIIFAAELHTVTKPAASPLGYHLFEVTAINEKQTPAFDEIRDTVLAKLKASTAEERFFDLLEEVEDRLAAGDNLTDVATALGLTPDMYEGFNSGETHGLSPRLQIAAFQQSAGETSEAIIVDDETTAFVQVTALRPAQTQAFEDVAEEVREDWMQAEVEKQLKEHARAIAAQPEGTALQDAMRTVGVSGSRTTHKGLTRTPTTAETLSWLNADARDALLRLGKNASIVQPVAAENAVYVVQLRDTHAPVLTQDDIAQAQSDEQRLTSNNLIGEFLNARLAKADISYNLPLLQNVFGSSFTADYFPTAKLEENF